MALIIFTNIVHKDILVFHNKANIEKPHNSLAK